MIMVSVAPQTRSFRSGIGAVGFPLTAKVVDEDLHMDVKGGDHRSFLVVKWVLQQARHCNLPIGRYIPILFSGRRNCGFSPGRRRVSGSMNWESWSFRTGRFNSHPLFQRATAVAVALALWWALPQAPAPAQETPAAEPRHPILAAKGGADERLLSEFTDGEWLALIPGQSPRKAAGFAELGQQRLALDKWEWTAHKPDQLCCTATGEVYPSAAFKVQQQSIEVLSGKTVDIPYVLGPDAKHDRVYVQAYIDYQKILFLEGRLSRLGGCYAGTGDERYARIAALVLDAWARVIPDYFIGNGNPGLPPISPQQAESEKWFVCRVSTYNAMAHEWPHLALSAFDAIFDSQALKDLSHARGYDVRTHIAQDFFANIGDVFAKRIKPEWAIRTNLSLPYMVLADCATILGRSDYILYLSEYLRTAIDENFKRDGMFPESFTYHRGYANVNLAAAERISAYFSHRPADSAPLRAISASCAERIAFLRRTTTAHFPVCYPNGLIPPFGDSAAAMDAPRTQTASALLPAYGHAALGGGGGAQQSQVNIGWGDFNNHCQDDVLGLTLFAFGTEVIGNNRYDRGPCRPFNNHTLGHNTVVIDRQTQPRSAADGLSTSGNLVIYDPGLDGVALAELDGVRAYPGSANRYQRLVIMNTVDPGHPYLIDVFVVDGGRTHDYVLHGSSTVGETATLSIPAEQLPGEHPLLLANERWTEPGQGTFPVYGLITHARQGRSPGAFDLTYDSRGAAVGTRLHMLDDGRSLVILGESPVLGSGGDTMEKEGAAETPATAKSRSAAQGPAHAGGGSAASRPMRPTVLVRREGNGSTPLHSVYVGIIEPFTGAPAITDIARLPLTTANDESVAVRIRFTDGREDIVLINLDDPSVAGCPGRTRDIATSDGRFALSGRCGIVIQRPGARAWAKTVGACAFSFGGEPLLLANAELAGTLCGAERRAAGAAADALITTAELPAGEALKGQWMSLSFGTYRSQNGKEQAGISEQFRIDHVVHEQGRTCIVMADDHGLEISADGITEIMRPHRHFTGPNSFRIVRAATTDVPR
jgi:hypothetical protein